MATTRIARSKSSGASRTEVLAPLVDAWTSIHDHGNDLDCCVFSYDESNTITVSSTGSGGLAEIISQLEESSIQFAGFQFQGHKRPMYAFLTWIGPKVPAVKRGRAANAALQITAALEKVEQVACNLKAMSQSDLDPDYLVEVIKCATKVDEVELASGSKDASYTLKGMSASQGPTLSSTTGLTIFDLQEVFKGLDSFGTGVINLRQFSSWWKREHSNENPGALITDKEWEEIRRLWIQFEIDSGGVDVGAFHKLTKQLKKDGLLNAVVAADAAEAEEAKKQHEVEQAVAAAAIPEGVPGISLGMVAKIKTVARAQHQRRLAAKARRKARERAEEEAKAKKQRDATVAKISELKADAEAAMGAKDYEGCVEKCEQAMALDEDYMYPEVTEPVLDLHTEAATKHEAQQHLRTAQQELGLKDFAGAAATLEKALALDPEDEEITRLKEQVGNKIKSRELQDQGEDLFCEEKYEEALALLQQAMALDPDNEVAEEDRVLADKKMRAGELKEEGQQKMAALAFPAAVEAFATAQKLDTDPIDEELQPLLESAQRNLQAQELGKQGELQLEHGMPQAALQSFEQALALGDEAGPRSLVPQEKMLLLAGKKQAEDALAAEQAAAAAAEAAAAREAAVTQLKEEAERKMAEKDYPAALGCLGQALALDSEETHPARTEVVALKEEAEKCARAAALVAQADEESKARDFSGAQQTVAAALALDPENERALALQEEIGRKLRAMELDAQSKEQMAAGDTRQALETLKAALELDPNNADAQADEVKAQKKLRAEELKEKGQALQAAGDHAKAVAAYDMGSDLDPEDEDFPALREAAKKKAKAAALAENGDLQLGQDQIDDAITSYTQAVELDPDNEAIQAKLAEAQQRAEDEEVQMVIKQLMDQADDQMDANDFAGAAATIQEALHLDPNNQRARMAAEEKERKQRNFEQIRELQRQGEEAMEGGDPDKALALFDEALALAPESMHEQLCNAYVSSTNQRVAALAKQGQTQYAAMKFDKSLASFDEAVELDDEGDEVLLAWQAKAKDANDKWNACEAILDEVETLFDAGELEAAAAKVEEAEEAAPDTDQDGEGDHPMIAIWRQKVALALENAEKDKLAAEVTTDGSQKHTLAPGHKLYDSDTNSTATVVSVHDDHVKIAREGDDGPTELPHDQAQEWANNHVVQAAASKAAAEVFVDLDLTDAGSFLNYRKFIKWWQTKTHSKGSLSARISDEELQVTMKIWQTFDEDGCGVAAEGLTNVMTGMMKAGVIRMRSDGTIITKAEAKALGPRGCRGD